MRQQLVMVVMCVMSLGAVARAAEPELGRIEQRLLELEQKVAGMQRELGATAELAEVIRQIGILGEEIEKLKVGEASVVAGESVHGLGPAASKVYGTERGVSIGGYGEMAYQSPASRRDDGEPSGSDARIDFVRGIVYVGYKWSDRLLFNSEIEFEHADTEEGGSVAVEFGYLDYVLNERFGGRAGLLLVPMGFVNELHEPPTFLAARRSTTESSIIPTTWRENGIGVFGDLGDFSYRAYLVNGLDAVGGGFSSAGIRGGRQKGSEALAEDFALTGRLDWSGIDGLLLGGAFYVGDSGQGAVAPTTGRSIGARTSLWDLHASYQGRGIYARGLYASAHIDDADLLNDARGLEGSDSIGARMSGFYLELGYDVLSPLDTEHALLPHVRLESLDTQDAVPRGFSEDPARHVGIRTFGIAWKPLAQAIVKLDYQDVKNDAGTGVDQLNVSVGWLF